jgi:hypothetical protein
MVAQMIWKSWEDRVLGEMTGSWRAAGQKMSWVRVVDALPHRTAQECRARARRLWALGCDGFGPLEPRSARNANWEAAEAIGCAMEALGRARAKKRARKVAIELDPFLLWRAPSHEDLLDEHGELVGPGPSEPRQRVQVDAYSEALCAW